MGYRILVSAPVPSRLFGSLKLLDLVGVGPGVLGTKDLGTGFDNDDDDDDSDL